MENLILNFALTRGEMKKILAGKFITTDIGEHKLCDNGCQTGGPNTCRTAEKPYDYCSTFTCTRPDGTFYNANSCVYS